LSFYIARYKKIESINQSIEEEEEEEEENVIRAGRENKDELNRQTQSTALLICFFR
jgi:hypothetical protein